MKIYLAARILLIACIVSVATCGRNSPDLRGFQRINEDPDFTRIFSYISPREAETRFTRAAEPKNVDEVDSYKAFLDKYFADSEANRPDYGSGRSQKLQSDAERIDGNSQEYDDAYNDSEYERIKAVSAEQEKEIKKNPKNCKVTLKDGMQCSICKNPKTGSHSESCSFSSTPPEKKYAYVKERNYNSKDQDKEKAKQQKAEEEADDDDDEEEDDEEDDAEDEKKSEASNTNEKKVLSTVAPTPVSSPKPILRNRGPPMLKQTTTQRSIPRKPQRSQSIRASTTEAPAQVRHQFHSSYKNTPKTESRPKRRVIGLDPYLYGSHSSDSRSEKLQKRKADDDADDEKSVEEDDRSKDRTYEDYFSHIFPEAKNGRLTRDEDEADTERDDVEFIPDYESKKNVEKVLAEFKTKDWSQCKKEIRGDLTCYMCKDDNGVRHEECMFVSGAGSKKEPKSSRLSYSETKEFHTPQSTSEPRKSENLRAEQSNDDDSGDEDDEIKVVVAKPTKSKKKKSSRKLVVRRRKVKQPKPEFSDEDVPSPEDVDEHQSGGTKKTIKRMVSFHIDNEGLNGAKDDTSDDPNKRSMSYEHQVVHTI